MRVSGHRFAIGVGLFVLGFAAPAFIPIVTASHFSSVWKAGISGFLALGLPEIMMIAAVAVMGKSGLAELKWRLSRLLRRYGPADAVSPARYRIGLVMFVAPLLVGWLGPYLGDYLPGFAAHPLSWSLSGDLVFLASFFVLGGDFWDKVRSLFVHRARAVLPAASAASREVSR
jgi:hypothetical protein